MGKVIHVSFKGRSRGRIIDVIGEVIEESIDEINSSAPEPTKEVEEDDEKNPA